MLYNFIDVNEQQTKASLPSEAMNFNGSFLEDLVPGYRTLSVVGRELATTEIQSYQLGIRDGMRHVYARIPERELTVKFKVEANSNEAFRDSFNRLNVALFTEKDVQIWFNDEPEMLWSGSKSDIDAVPEGLNRVIGTFTILLNNPYKYTRSDATSVMWGSTEITFQAYWGSTMITFQNRSYLMGDNGQEVKPIEIYPTVEGLKVKPIITI
ncbi:distal tail protein Dit, partial [Enterococcus faecalis]|uniref:distal tail protein Dit n=1 Tax=Enterococcus faecalis TaxID=1351 RepID=UPI0022DF0D8E